MFVGFRYSKVVHQKNKAILDNITDHALKTINKARELAILLPTGSDMHQLVDRLALYLEQQKDSIYLFFLNDYLELKKKAKFIESCVDAMTKGDVDALEKHLVEEKIMQFKGFFSNEMYNLLAPYQALSAKRLTAISQSISLLPTAVVDIIAKYDKDIHREAVQTKTPLQKK